MTFFLGFSKTSSYGLSIFAVWPMFRNERTLWLLLLLLLVFQNTCHKHKYLAGRLAASKQITNIQHNLPLPSNFVREKYIAFSMVALKKGFLKQIWNKFKPIYILLSLLKLSKNPYEQMFSDRKKT